MKCENCKKLRKKIRDLREEVSNLNGLLSDADEDGWDQEGLYEDARDGKFNGNDIGGTPDPEQARWLAERYNLKLDEDGDII